MNENNNNNIKDELQEKIDLIEREITGRNLNKNLFIDYLSTKKIFGDDLSKWTYDDLQQVVFEYIKYHSDELSNNNINDNIDNNTINQNELKNIENEKIKQDINNLQQTNTQNQILKNKEIKEIQCKKLEPSVLSEKKIEVIIRNPKAIRSSMFKSNYILYEVYTKETNWLATRRFSDFEWLRSALVKFYPRFFCPPLPNKKLWSRRFEVDFVEKRMKFLNKFINNVLLNETFKACDIVIDFLSISDHNQFEAKVYEYNSITPSGFIEDTRTLTGTVKTLEDQGNEHFYENILNYFKIQNSLYNRLNYNLKNFYYNLEAAAKNLEEVEKDFETFFNLNQKVMMKEEITKTFEELKLFFKNWRKILINQNNYFKIYIKDFFKYHSKESLAFEELLISRQDLKYEYETNLQKLLNKKEKLWATNDITKWEIDDYQMNNQYNQMNQMILFRDKMYAFSKMCTKETFIVENYHKQLNYANYMNNEELKTLINLNCNKYLDNIKEFTEKLYTSLNDSLTVWSDLASYFTSK